MSDERFKSLCEIIPEAMQRLHIPGVAVGVLSEGQKYTAGFGVTSIENPLPVDAETLFQVGSISKTFTGTLAMRLVEEGKLDLDIPVRTYLPDLKLADESVTSTVTMRHLFSHTGGWVGDLFDDTGWGDDALAKMAAQVASCEQLTPLGQIYSYNNAGFYIAGRVIEVITGKTFEQAAAEYILHPLEMYCSFYNPWDVMTYRFASGHDVVEEKAKVFRPWWLARNAAPVGSLTASIEDMLKYARFHLGDGTSHDGSRLLMPESLTQMRGSYIETDDVGNSVGITFFSKQLGGKHIFGHGGATGGQKAQLHLCAEAGFGIIILTNGDYGSALIGELSERAFDLYLGVKASPPSSRVLTDTELSEIVGHYEMPLTGIDLRNENGKLIAHVTDRGGFPTKDSPPSEVQPPPAELQFYDATHCMVMDGPAKGGRGQIIRDEDGKVAWLRLFGRIHRAVR